MKTWILVLTAASYGCSSSGSTTDTSASGTADAGVSAIADSGVSATADSGSETADAGSAAADAGFGKGDSGSNVRSPPSEGGTSGTVDSVSTPTFVITTATGQKVTVNETSSTAYWSGTSSVLADAIATGETVLVLGVVSSTTITASQVTVEPNDGGGAAASAAAGVVPFQPGAPSAAKQVGQIPSYTEGQGTIVSGTTADQATEAALAAYPGVLVDRVVELSGGDYEVHCISVNWPHHVFVATDFTVVGAD